jgi:4-hydroxybenzoate polyprenyltransferase
VQAAAKPNKVRVLLGMIRWEHTIFALPFAYAGMLAAPVPFTWWNLVWITVAMFGARAAGMTLNRIIDAKIDARNPRTKDREIPRGLVGLREAWVFTGVSIGLLVLATFALEPITRLLWPLVVLGFIVYPFTKRFTPFCHLALGVANGLAPGAAWVAVTGEVSWTPALIWAGAALWVAGFDVIYALLDREFDVKHQVHSLPARFGARTALRIARLWHLLAVAFFVAFGAAAGLGVFYFLGVTAIGGLLVYEHFIVREDDFGRLNAAFFNVNAVVSMVFLAAVLLDRVVS